MSLDAEINVLDNVPSSFRPFIQNLWKDDIGLSSAPIQIEQIQNTSDNKCNHYKLLVPYAGKLITWEVIFDSTAPWLAPDFRFNDDKFLMKADCDYMEAFVPSLVGWDSQDPEALSKVIQELLVLYRNHQISMINPDAHSRAHFEYTALLSDDYTDDKDIEVWVEQELGGVVRFMIRLNVDTSQLYTLHTEKSLKDISRECVALVIDYPNNSGAEIIMSPLVRKYVGNINLPQVPQDDVLMDYLPIVTSLLNKKIAAVLSNDKNKKELLSQFVVKYDRAVLEHDDNFAAFLFDIDKFHWILHIDIKSEYPEKPPELTIRSVYHQRNGRPRVRPLPACPQRDLLPYIAHHAQLFKQECSTALDLNPPLPTVDNNLMN